MCVFLAAAFLNEKIADIWNFYWIKYLGKGLSYLKKMRYKVQLLLRLRAVEVATSYRLDQLNSKHTKIAVNSTIQYFEGCSQKKCLLKVWSFLVHPPQNSGTVKFFAKLNRNHVLMTNIFKLHEYQTFGLMKIHNMYKIWFANKIFSLWKSLVYD